MEVFSSDCEGCGHPLLCPAATNSINTWMSEVVAITANGSQLRGTYDGYGRVDVGDLVLDESTVWHLACWRAQGSPTEYRGASKSSADQGWFFEDGAHDLGEPGTMKIRVENTYSDGYESVQEREIAEYTGDPDDDELFAEHVRPYTGDGHGIGNRLHSIHEVTVLESSNPALVGRTEEYGG